MSSFIIADIADVEAHSTRPTAATPLNSELAGLDDEVLLKRFLASRDAEAFETLVARHGPTVMRVCRRWLGPGQQADDAFQATFLVLVNRAAAIRRKENIGPWLRGVAHRVAGRLKMQADHRQKREGAAVEIHEVAAASLPLFDDLGDVVRNEVERLPEAYRSPIMLCYWEGLSSEQAAERLRCPTGTLKWRLARARDLLRKRLSKLSLGVMLFLFGHRSPTASAADAFPDAANSGLLGQTVLGEGPPQLSRTLLSKTVAIASYLRDNPLSIPLPAALKPVRRRRVLGFWFWTAVAFVAAGAVATAALPNIPVVQRLAAASFPSMFGSAPSDSSTSAATPATSCH